MTGIKAPVPKPSMDRYGNGGTGVLPLYQTTGGQQQKKTAARPPGLGIASQFNISGYMILASFVFWICMGIFGFKVIQYASLYHQLDDSDLDELHCCTSFGGPIENNVNIVDAYEKGDSGPYLMRLGPETYSEDFKGTAAPKELEQIPPIVTAVSTSDYWAVQSLIKQWKEELKPKLTGARLIIYDIGLYSKELDLIKQHCDCDVRTFQTSSYPNHVADISTFAYRPIIIQSIIEEFGSVLWMDPTSLFTRASDLNQLKYRGERDFFLWQPSNHVGLLAYTNLRMFQYLKESRCCFADSSLMDMSTMVFYRTPTTWRNIMKPWLKCALNNDCINPTWSRYSECFEMRSPKTTGCHRYDQSAFSIIMERVYEYTVKSEKYVTPRISRQQEEYLEYFPEQPWKYTELFFVSIMPLACVGGLFYLYMRRTTSTRGKSNYNKR